MPFDQQNFEPMPSDPVLQQLIEGRARVASGWCKGVLYDFDGRFCARGAVIVHNIIEKKQYSYGHNDVGWRAEQALYAALPSEWNGDHDGPHCSRDRIAYFNNATTTTQADVLALFDRAIAARNTELLATNEVGARHAAGETYD